MRKIIILLAVVAMVILVSFVGFIMPGQVWSEGFSQDTELLYTMARTSWAPVELQSLGYFNMHISPGQCVNRLRKSCLLLQAAQKLDNSNTAVLYDLFSMFISPAINDSGRALDCLVAYSKLKPNDSFIVESWLNYQLDNMNSRKAREDFLRQSMPALQNYPYVLSQVQNQMGVMALEKGDTKGAIKYFNQAFSTSAFNDQALGRLLSVTMPVIKRDNIDSQPLWQSASLQNWYQQNALRWRLRIRNNPYDITAMLNFIQTLQISGHYKMALQYYPYAFKLLKMSGAPAADIAGLKLQQLSVAYSAGQYKTCLRIANSLLKDNPYDLLVLSVKAMALQKLGETVQAQKILQMAAAHSLAELKAQLTKNQTKYQPKIQAAFQTKSHSQNQTESRGQAQNSTGKNISAQAGELAWFFCFVMPDPQRALQYSMVNYKANHTNIQVQATLAYARIMNKDYQQAQSLLKLLDTNDPLVVLARARLLATQGQKTAARRLLNSLTQTQTGIIQENIRRLYSLIAAPTSSSENIQPGMQKKPQTDLASSLAKASSGNTKSLATLSPFAQMERFFAVNFNNKDLQIVDHPEKFIKCYMKFPRDIYYAGEPVNAKIYLTNTSSMPLLVGQDSFLNPHVVIMAQLQPLASSGIGAVNDVSQPVDTTKRGRAFSLIPLLHRYISGPYILAAGQSVITRVQLNIETVGKTLQDNPQKTYRITFYTFLDPVIDAAGNITSKISALQPKAVTITRIGFVPERMRLNNRLEAMQSGSCKERINAANLISSLLREAQLARKNRLSYQPLAINTSILQSALLACLNDGDYRVRAFAVHDLAGLDLLVSRPVINKMVNLLNDKNWLVRFMAIDTLEPVTDLTDYFKWGLIHEKNNIVKRQIELLAHRPWETKAINIQPETAKQSSVNNSTGVNTNNQ